MTNSDKRSIFDSLGQQLRRDWLQALGGIERGVLVFPRSEVDSVAHSIFPNLSQGGFATFVVSGRQQWDPRSYYFELMREAARDGCSIIHAFLLPHRQYLREEVLYEHWQLDTQAGIDVRMLYVGDLLSGFLTPQTFALDFGLWDEQVVCTEVASHDLRDAKPSEWRVSNRQEDIDLAHQVRDELLAKAPSLPFPNNEPTLDLEEPMVQTAPLMELLSDAVCSGSYLAADDCSWYHGIWQYLRIFDMVSTPTWHPKLYLPFLYKLAKERDNARVLISGTADYSMLSHVLWAFDSSKKRCDVTVLDICQTPLIICQWYARHNGQVITTVKSDILGYDPKMSYDAIVTDAFLTRFSKSERSAVIAHWRQLLKSDGLVITTARISSATSDGQLTNQPNQVESFRSRAYEQALRWQDFLPGTPDEIAEQAQHYAERMVSQPFSSAEEVRSAFIEQGFVLDHFDVVQVKGELIPTTYTELVARKVDTH